MDGEKDTSQTIYFILKVDIIVLVGFVMFFFFFYIVIDISLEGVRFENIKDTIEIHEFHLELQLTVMFENPFLIF